MSFTISLVSQGRHHVVCFFFLVGLFETKFPSTSVFMENSATMFFRCDSFWVICSFQEVQEVGTRQVRERHL